MTNPELCSCGLPKDFCQRKAPAIVMSKEPSYKQQIVDETKTRIIKALENMPYRESGSDVYSAVIELIKGLPYA